MLHDELSIIMYGMGFKKLILRQTSLIRELCSEDVFQGTVKKLYIHTHTHTQNGILPSKKKNEILPFATMWMDLEVIMYSGVNQTEKDKYCMLLLIRGI